MGNLLQSFSDLEKIKIKRQYKLVKLVKNGDLLYLRKVNDQEKIGFVCECSFVSTNSGYKSYDVYYYDSDENSSELENNSNQEIELIERVIGVPVDVTLNQSTNAPSMFNSFQIRIDKRIYIKPVNINGYEINFISSYSNKINTITLNVPSLANYSASTFELDVPLEIYFDSSYTKKVLSQTINITLLFNSEEPEGD